MFPHLCICCYFNFIRDTQSLVNVFRRTYGKLKLTIYSTLYTNIIITFAYLECKPLSDQTVITSFACGVGVCTCFEFAFGDNPPS